MLGTEKASPMFPLCLPQPVAITRGINNTDANTSKQTSCITRANREYRRPMIFSDYIVIVILAKQYYLIIHSQNIKRDKKHTHGNQAVSSVHLQDQNLIRVFLLLHVAVGSPPELLQ